MPVNARKFQQIPVNSSKFPSASVLMPNPQPRSTNKLQNNAPTITMDPDKLASTNQVLHDLERKLSLVSSSSSTQTAQSHGSVVQDPTYSGLARKNIQSSVLQYIKDNKSEFDADRVFSDRQHKFATTFTREYSPSHSSSELPEKPKDTRELEKTVFSDDLRHPNNKKTSDSPSQVAGYVHTCDDIHGFSSSYASDDYVDYFDDDFDNDFGSGDEDETLTANDHEHEHVNTCTIGSYSTNPKRDSAQPSRSSLGTITLDRSSSILKKVGTGEYRHSNKSVTFENLGDLHLDEDDCYPDDVIDFSDNYYSVGHDDVASEKFNDGDCEKHSEVLSDTYSAEAPLQIRKPRTNNSLETSDFQDFAQPKFGLSGDNASIGSFSPDTPSTEQFHREDKDENESKLRRSLILDRLNIVTSGIQGHVGKPVDAAHEPTFGGSLGSNRASDEDSDGSQYEAFFADQLKRRATGAANLSNHDVYDENEASDDQYSRKSLSVEEVNTPLTSVNSLSCVSGSPKPPIVAVEKRKQRPFHDSFMPILGQLDELTERLAELEHIL
ncbi:hypothetical protein JCM33374_g4750 [Metschnikowia sp. JCM 33374]|nr:hypothetical protein JCM33374_g4750 [Metschnikowia sp. JCM 33374]